MELHAPALLLICIVAGMIAGCTSGISPAAPAVPVPVVSMGETPATIAPTPMNAMSCSAYTDCLPAQCCHPTGCINRVARQPCNGMACTENCEGPLDCGAGSCGCVRGTCSIVAAPSPVPAVTNSPAVRLEASPQRYSPIMSSTPGIALTVNTTGTGTAGTTFVWTASYGHFLSWNPSDYTVNVLDATVTNHGERLYWSFIKRPSSTTSPVVVTVVARDSSGSELGRSVVTLAWEGDYAVTVQDIR